MIGMVNRKAFALMLCLLVAISFAEKIETPQLVSSASIVLNEDGTVTVSNGEMRKLSVNISIPLSTGYQDVKLETDEQIYYDPEANPYIHIYSENPSIPFNYMKTMTVQTVARTTPSLPESYIVPAEFSHFASATERTQSDDAQIRQLALQITANSTDQFEKVAKLATFVNKYMTYDERLAGEEKDALWVLQTRQGVCVEYSTLFAALARSIGIPTKYVTGYVYSDKYSRWLGHAWNEVYLGEWVPVDATWFEVGTVDALHVEAGKYSELLHDTPLTARISNPAATIKWETSGRSGAFADNIQTQSVESADPSSDFELKAAEPNLAPGDKTIVYLAIDGKDYRVIPLTLSTCSGGNTVEIANAEQHAILEPGKKTVVAWEITTGSSFPDNYEYIKCPLTLNSPYLEHRFIEIRVSPTTQILPPFSASLQERDVEIGQSNSVLLTVPQKRQNRAFYIITPDAVYSKRMDSQSGSVPFTVTRLGSATLYAAAAGGGFQKLEYQSGTDASMKIDSFALPQTSIEGRGAKAVVNISAKSYPADVDLEFSFGGETMKKSGRASEPSSFVFDFVPKNIGGTQVSIRALSNGAVLDEKNAIVDVEEQPDMEISRVKTTVTSGGLSAVVSFSQTGTPLLSKLVIGNKVYSADSDANFVLPAGVYPAELSWVDMAGNRYSKQVSLAINEPGILDDLKSKTTTQAGACPLALVILGATLLAAIKR